jgi:large conductance mechanosensitive channel
VLKGFKDFIMRGNVIELAIGVVIGVAFQAVVSSFVSAIITPIVNAFGGKNTNGLGFSLRHTAGVAKNGPLDALGKSTFINFSTIINAAITFITTALVVYFIFVVPMNKFQERRAARLEKAEPTPEPKPDDVVLLEQIRDLLAKDATPS